MEIKTNSLSIHSVNSNPSTPSATHHGHHHHHHHHTHASSPYRSLLSPRFHHHNVAATPRSSEYHHSKQHAKQNYQSQQHESAFLEYGMIVSIVSEEMSGVLAGEGFADLELRLEPIPTEDDDTNTNDDDDDNVKGSKSEKSYHYQDCLFEIFPKQSYDATVALRDKLEKLKQDSMWHFHGTTHTTKGSSHHGEFVAELRFKSESEQRLNKVVYNKLVGTRVKFGQVIQFRHLKSNKFITIESDAIADLEIGKVHVGLASGSLRSHFSITPRFKLRKKGEDVQFTDKLVFSNDFNRQRFSLFSESLTTEDTDNSTAGNKMKLFASTHVSTKWRAVFYDRVDVEPENLAETLSWYQKNLRAGDCIRIQHIETNSWLCTRVNAETKEHSICLESTASSSTKAATTTVHYSDEAEEDVGGIGVGSSQSLWEVEHRNRSQGGPVTWDETIRLRNLCSGQYMVLGNRLGKSESKVRPRNSRAFDFETTVEEVGKNLRSESETRYDMSLAYTTASSKMNFVLSPTDVTRPGAFVGKSSIVCIQHDSTRCCLHAAAAAASSNNGSGSASSSDLTHSKVHCVDGIRDEDAFLLIPASPAEVNDTLFLLSMTRVLRDYVTFLQDHTSRRKRDFGPSTKMLAVVERVISDLIFFCIESDTEDVKDALNAKGPPRRSRQRLFRYQGYVELLVEVIKCPFKNHGGPFSVADLRHPSDILDRNDRNDVDVCRLEADGTEPPKGMKAEVEAMEIRDSDSMKKLRRILRLSNTLLMHILRDYDANHVHVVNVAAPVLMELLGNGFGTSIPLSHLLQENRTLIESLDTSILQRFFDLIVSHGRSIRYLQFLSSLTAAGGSGIQKMQEAACDLLFNSNLCYQDKVLFKTRVSQHSHQIFDVLLDQEAPSARFGTGSRDFSGCINEDTLLVSSSAGDGDGENQIWIGLLDFVRRYPTVTSRIGRYFRGQIELFTAMCIDRNYSCIDRVRNLFPREALFTCVTNMQFSLQLRTAFIQLFLAAYVDVDPQCPIPIPCYTRIWSSLSDKLPSFVPDETSGVAQNEENRIMFVAIKKWINSYLEDLKDGLNINEHSENELTLSVLELLRKLVEFGFYNDENELSAIAVPLVRLLDGRNDVVSEDTVGNGRSKAQRGTILLEEGDSEGLGSQRIAPTLAQLKRKTLFASAIDSKSELSNSRSKLRARFKTIKKLPQQILLKEKKDGAGLPTATIGSTETEVLDAAGQSAYQRLRYRLSAKNKSLMLIKEEVCKILLLFERIRLDYQISKVLLSFYNKHNKSVPSNQAWEALFHDQAGTTGMQQHLHSQLLHKVSPLARYTFDQKSLHCSLSLNELSQREVVPLLMDLIMYEFPPLTTKALELLSQQYNQHDQLLIALSNVQLLVSEETVEVYQKLNSVVTSLRKSEEATEIWMDLTCDTDFREASNLCCLLSSLTEIMFIDPEDNRRYGSGIVSIEASDFLDTPSEQGPWSPRNLPPAPLQRLNEKIDLQSIGSVSHQSSTFNSWNGIKSKGDEDDDDDMDDVLSPTEMFNDETRRLVRNMNAVQHVIKLIIGGSHFFEASKRNNLAKKQQQSVLQHTTLNSRQETQRQMIIIQKVYAHCFDFLRVFCMDNQVNQEVVFQHVHLIIEYLGEVEGVQPLLAAIFAHNISLCSRITEEVIHAFFSNIISQGPQPQFLFFLESVVYCDEEPIKENQRMVLSLMTNPNYSKFVLQHFDEYSGVEKIIQLMEEAKTLEDTCLDLDDPTSAESSRLSVVHMSLEYHVRLIHLLSACAVGSNSHLKSKCRNVIPIDVVLEILEHPSCSKGMKAPLIRFLGEVFITCGVRIQPPLGILLGILIYLKNETERSVQVIAREAKEFDAGACVLHHAYLNQLKINVESEEKDFCIKIMVPAIWSFMKQHQTSEIFDSNQGKAVAQHILNALQAILYLIGKKNWIDEAKEQVYFQLLAYLSQMLNLETTEKWKKLTERTRRTDLKSINLSGQTTEISVMLMSLQMVASKSDFDLEAVGEKTTLISPAGFALATMLPRKQSAIVRRSKSRFSLGLDKTADEEDDVAGDSSPTKYLAQIFSFRKPLKTNQTLSQDGLQRRLASVKMNLTSPACEDQSLIDGFITALQNNVVVQATIKNEFDQMLRCIIDVETAMKEFQDESDGFIPGPKLLTFEQVVSRMISHIKESRGEQFNKMNLALLGAFSHMISNTDSKKDMNSMQRQLDNLGATELVIFLISSSSSDDLIFEACVDLGIALLDGLNGKVQDSFYKHWINTGESKFFERIQERLIKASEEAKTEFSERSRNPVLQRKHENAARSDDAPEVKSPSFVPQSRGRVTSASRSVTRVLRFLQLLCEGHNATNQNYLISQSAAPKSVNLVEATMTYLLEVFNVMSAEHMSVIIQVFETVTEFCQGPCAEAQESVATYKFLSVVNTLLMESTHFTSEIPVAELRTVRASIAVMLRSLLEGRDDHVIHGRLVHELSLEALRYNLSDVYKYFIQQYKGRYQGNSVVSTDPHVSMGFNIYILMQELIDSDPELAKMLLPSSPKTQVSRSAASGVNFVDMIKNYFFKSTVIVTADIATSESVVDSSSGSLSSLVPEDEARLYDRAYCFFQARCARVEIMWNMNDSREILTPVYFPIHPICFCLTATSKSLLIWRVDRGSAKLNDFFSRTDDLISEMQHQSRLQQHPTLASIVGKGDFFKIFTFVLAVLINILILLFYQATDLTSEPTAQLIFDNDTKDEAWYNEAINLTISLLGTVQVIVCSMVVFCFLVNSAPLVIKRKWQLRNALKQRRQNLRPTAGATHDGTEDTESMLRTLREKDEFHIFPTAGTHAEAFKVWLLSLWFLFRSSIMMYYIWLIIIAFLGSYVHAFYFSFHLLDVVNRYQELRNVLRAVVRPRKALLLTVVLYLVVTYVYSIIGFFYFRADFTPELDGNSTAEFSSYRCKDLLTCFLTTLDEGFKNDGGLGGYLAPRELGADSKAYARLVYDNLYNVMLVIVLLNIVFGVIIDTFAALRTQHKEKSDDMKNRCFICSIDRYTFDQVTKRGFEYHFQHEHNLWHYVYYFAHIREKPFTEYNGIELYMARRMAKADVSFFPNHRAMVIQKYEQEMNGEESVGDNDAAKHDEGNRGNHGITTMMIPPNRRAMVENHAAPRYLEIETKLDAVATVQKLLQEQQKSLIENQQQILDTLDSLATSNTDSIEASSETSSSSSPSRSNSVASSIEEE